MSALQLETAASVLGPVVDEVVFVGGATVYLWITEPGAPPVRATEDVDVICEVASRVEYYRLGDRLRERGLMEAAGEPVLCRWRSVDPELILDVMPTDAGILGFSNPWYEEVIATAETVTLDSGVEIRAAKPVALMATKLSAWKGRGEGDLLRSLDIHDVLTLVDGRRELAAEIEAAPPDLRAYVRDELIKLQAERDFDYAVEARPRDTVRLAPTAPTSSANASTSSFFAVDLSPPETGWPAGSAAAPLPRRRVLYSIQRCSGSVALFSAWSVTFSLYSPSDLETAPPGQPAVVVYLMPVTASVMSTSSNGGTFFSVFVNVACLRPIWFPAMWMTQVAALIVISLAPGQIRSTVAVGGLLVLTNFRLNSHPFNSTVAPPTPLSVQPL